MNFEIAKEATKFRSGANQCRQAAAAIREVLHGLYGEESFRTVIAAANDVINSVYDGMTPETSVSLKRVMYYEYMALLMDVRAAQIVYENTD